MKILLISKQRTFLVDREQKKFHCQYGIIDLSKAKFGKKIKSSLGYEFLAVEPTIIDMLGKCRRGPQIVMPKDAASIVSVTGIRKEWKCLDAGSGSGFLTIFIGSLVGLDGKVYAYETNKRNFEIVKKNVKFCGLERIVITKNKDAKKFTEKNLDLITLDMPGAEKIVKKCHKALKPGGWLCIYSPHIEQQTKVRNEIEKLSFIHVQTIENIQRRWSSLKGFTHPKPSGIMHTGFLTFARKI